MSSFVEGCLTSSWGRIRHVPHAIAKPRYRDELINLLNSRGGRAVLAVGARRSYGDTILNSNGCLIEMQSLDRVMSFDPKNGILRAEAGLTFRFGPTNYCSAWVVFCDHPRHSLCDARGCHRQ